MKLQTALKTEMANKSKSKALLATLVTVLLVGGVAYDTKVVRIGSIEDVREQVFSPKMFGASEFPAIQSSVIERAIDAQVLYEAIAKNKVLASKKYGVAAGIGAVIPVYFEGIVGEGKAGVYQIFVATFPDNHVIRVQTGPAINGTELRDATGTIEFGQFKNQIEYQNAGAALNNAMKAITLADIDNSTLTGKKVVVTGVFKLINPKNWLITPVRFEVK